MLFSVGLYLQCAGQRGDGGVDNEKGGECRQPCEKLPTGPKPPWGGLNLDLWLSLKNKRPDKDRLARSLAAALDPHTWSLVCQCPSPSPGRQLSPLSCVFPAWLLCLSEWCLLLFFPFTDE